MVEQYHCITLRVSPRELATILAALRFHQEENLQGGQGLKGTSIEKIASNNGAIQPLEFGEVSVLYRRLSRAARQRKPG
jgi:hypothetical protein